MKKTLLKNVALVLASVMVTASLVVGGTVAYLQDTDSDVNVMTVGNVYIAQHEYQRATNADGSFKTGSFDGLTSYVLEPFEQGKPIYPSALITNGPGWGWDTTTVRMSQVGSYGGMQVFTVASNAVDKFVTVENTGKSDAYVRTLVAIEVGSTDGSLFGTSYHSTWTKNVIGIIEVDGYKYVLTEYLYKGGELSDGSWRHENGVLPAGDTSYPNLSQVYIKSAATNEDIDAIDGNGNGTLDILVLSQAVQVAGFADAKTALDTAFGKSSEKAAEWFGGTYIPEYSLAPIEPDANGVVTLSDGEKRVLVGNYNSGITVNGNGTLYLRDNNIDATATSTLAADTKVDALTVNSSDVKLVIEGNVTLKGVAGGNGICVPAGVKLDLSGEGGSLTAVGYMATEDKNVKIGGSGIGGAGEIYIHDLKQLVAEGYGVGGFGIGGATTSIVIENSYIKYAKGGFVQDEVETEFGKGDPEGGAAIGSLTNGAVITLKNVTIDKADGGSKAAAIGARYWTGVTINIDGCTIKAANGGNASAGIGGSRVPGGATEAQNIKIIINDSIITAKGGGYGAGIGSGYDTHCEGKTTTTIIITGASTINAKGGRYGAGIGTGYHVADLYGKIDPSVVVNAVGGGNREKYTVAMDVGYGVIDKTREGKDCAASFDYKGTEITVASTTDVK